MSTPRLTTGLRIEGHTCETYTWSMFLEVRKEIYMGMFHCMPIEHPGSNDIKNYTVRHCKTNMTYVNEFEVSPYYPICFTIQLYTTYHLQITFLNVTFIVLIIHYIITHVIVIVFFHNM